MLCALTSVDGLGAIAIGQLHRWTLRSRLNSESTEIERSTVAAIVRSSGMRIPEFFSIEVRFSEDDKQERRAFKWEKMRFLELETGPQPRETLPKRQLNLLSGSAPGQARNSPMKQERFMQQVMCDHLLKSWQIDDLWARLSWHFSIFTRKTGRADWLI